MIKLRNSSTNDTPDTGIIQQDAKNDTYFIMKQASDGNIEVLSVIDYKKVKKYYMTNTVIIQGTTTSFFLIVRFMEITIDFTTSG